jgi:hypothetical protein
VLHFAGEVESGRPRWLEGMGLVIQQGAIQVCEYDLHSSRLYESLVTIGNPVIPVFFIKQTRWGDA